jgi:hypothetical protein
MSLALTARSSLVLLSTNSAMPSYNLARCRDAHAMRLPPSQEEEPQQDHEGDRHPQEPQQTARQHHNLRQDLEQLRNRRGRSEGRILAQFKPRHTL